jgi:hypothetical protein
LNSTAVTPPRSCATGRSCCTGARGTGIPLVVPIWSRAFPALAHVDGFYGKRS